MGTPSGVRNSSDLCKKSGGEGEECNVPFSWGESCIYNKGSQSIATYQVSVIDLMFLCVYE